MRKSAFFCNGVSSSLNKHHNMPPQRTPMGEISGNRPKGKHLTPYMRGKITGCRLFSSSPAEIAMGLNIGFPTVRYTLSVDYLCHEGSTQPKNPRRKSYFLDERRKLFRYVYLHPKNTYKQIKTTCALVCSTSALKRILKRILKRHSITNWRYKRQLYLIKVHAAKRLAW
jgi:hypothetical protein